MLLVLHELVHEVRADEARPTSDQDPQVSLKELGEAEGRGGRRRAGGDVIAVAAISLLLRHRVEHRAAGSWGLGSACLARTRGTGGLNRIRLGRTRRRPLRSESYL